MPHCNGRRTTPKSDPLFFTTCPRLHKNKPLSFLGVTRCKSEAVDLCDDCLARKHSTDYQLEKRGNKYIPNQETMFHGRFDEPIPLWSRLYKGPWFQKQLDAGYTVSSEVSEKAEAMLQATYKEISREPTDRMVEGSTPPKPPPKKKFVLKKPVEPIAEPVTEPVAQPIAKPIPRKKPPTKPSHKAHPIGLVTTTFEEELAVKKVSVKKTEIDGRSVYVDSIQNKVYDLKFSYAGNSNL